MFPDLFELFLYGVPLLMLALTIEVFSWRVQK